MRASLPTRIVVGLSLVLPGLAVAADSLPDDATTYLMKIGTELETGKVVKSGNKTVFVTCPGGKIYDIDQSLTKTVMKCPLFTGPFGSFTGKLLESDTATGFYKVMTKDGETKSLSTAPDLLKGLAKGQDLWVAIDKTPLSTPYALERVQ
jgi:hypothetical protein